MARNKDKASGKQVFSANPFKQLKGFAVSKEEVPAPVTKPQAKVEELPEEELFAHEMERLGVKEQPSAMPGRALPPETALERRPAPTPPPKDDGELFLHALGRMDAVFRDEFPEEPQLRAQPARMKQLRQGRLTPQAQLDLHGLSRETALERVGFFLQDAAYQGWGTVLVITGQGKRSEDGPVLRAAVERYLAEAGGAWVAEWGRAPARYGGDGALVVFLKARGRQ